MVITAHTTGQEGRAGTVSHWLLMAEDSQTVVAEIQAVLNSQKKKKKDLMTQICVNSEEFVKSL